MFFNDRHISYNIRVLHISSTKIIRMQVKERSFVLNMTYENMFFFSNRVVNAWNSLPNWVGSQGRS